jgi:hypothetical protein
VLVVRVSAELYGMALRPAAAGGGYRTRWLPDLAVSGRELGVNLIGSRYERREIVPVASAPAPDGPTGPEDAVRPAPLELIPGNGTDHSIRNDHVSPLPPPGEAGPGGGPDVINDYAPGG